MPAYSFQERFIPSIEDESKTHTIRAIRKGRSKHALPGDKLYLYYGMRTKYCRKIGEATCTAVVPIRITHAGIWLAEYTATEHWEGPKQDLLQWPLSGLSGDRFAWSDGFRPDRSTKDNPAGAFQLMLRFWKQTHDLPFEGVVIYWKDFIPAK